MSLAQVQPLGFDARKFMSRNSKTNFRFSNVKETQNESLFDSIVKKFLPASELIFPEDVISFTRSQWEQKVSGDVESFIENLMNITKESSFDNWDGYGANKLNIYSIFYAIQFVFSLPSYIPKPELVAEPSGLLALQWSIANSSFVLSINKDKNISFAKILTNREEIYGVIKYNSKVPVEILGHIDSIYKANA